jgi:hypothetical protein
MLNQNRANALRAAHAGKECDRWGNLRADHAEIIEERHRDNFIKILIHEYNGCFFYGYQIKIETLVEQKAANINASGHSAREAARRSAVFEIENICAAHRTARKAFADFTKIRYNQQELFTEDMYERRYPDDN